MNGNKQEYTILTFLIFFLACVFGSVYLVTTTNIFLNLFVIHLCLFGAALYFTRREEAVFDNENRSTFLISLVYPVSVIVFLFEVLRFFVNGYGSRMIVVSGLLLGSLFFLYGKRLFAEGVRFGGMSFGVYDFSVICGVFLTVILLSNQFFSDNVGGVALSFGIGWVVYSIGVTVGGIDFLRLKKYLSFWVVTLLTVGATIWDFGSVALTRYLDGLDQKIVVQEKIVYEEKEVIVRLPAEKESGPDQFDEGEESNSPLGENDFDEILDLVEEREIGSKFLELVESDQIRELQPKKSDQDESENVDPQIEQDLQNDDTSRCDPGCERKGKCFSVPLYAECNGVTEAWTCIAGYKENISLGVCEEIIDDRGDDTLDISDSVIPTSSPNIQSSSDSLLLQGTQEQSDTNDEDKIYIENIDIEFGSDSGLPDRITERVETNKLKETIRDGFDSEQSIADKVRQEIIKQRALENKESNVVNETERDL